MVDETGAIADREYVIEFECLECVSNFDESLIVPRELIRSLVVGKCARRGTGCPDDEIRR